MTEFIISNPHPLEVQEDRLPLSFFVSTPEKANKDTIPIVVIHGYGDYANSDYMKSVHSSLTNKYNIAIITVNYVGTFTKAKFTNTNPKKPYKFLNYSMEITPGENKKVFLQLLYALFHNDQKIISLLYAKKIINVTNFIPYQRALGLLISRIENNLCDGNYIIERLYEMEFNSAITSMVFNLAGDHQDFGIIQSIDILTAIKHIKDSDGFNFLNWSKLSIVGTSHGGYLASMCDKLAPNTFNKIINNAGWLYSTNSEIFSKQVKNFFSSKMEFESSENTYWSEDPTNNNYFNIRHEEIRSLINIIHIDEQSQQTLHKENKDYIYSHALNDTIININEKDNYIDTIKKYYSNINYKRLDCEEKLDGKTFKNLDHGSAASLKGLVIDFIVNNNFDKRIERDDFDLKSVIKYSCTDGNYTINFTKKYPTILFN